MKPIEQWRKLLHECVARRIEVDVFRKLVKLLSKRAPIQQASLVDVLLESRSVTADVFSYDPLIPRYASILRKLGLIRTSSLLNGLMKHSFIESQDTTTEDEKSAIGNQEKKTVKPSTLMTDTRIVQDVIAPLSSSNLNLNAQEVQSIFTSASEWILTVVRWHTSNINEDQQLGGMMHSPDALALFESLGILLVALSATERGHEALSSDSSQGMRTSDSHIEVDFESLLIQWCRLQNPVGPSS